MGTRSNHRRGCRAATAARRLVAAVVIPPLVGSAAKASSFTWTGADPSSLLNSPQNWSGGAAPPSDGTADLNFGPSSGKYTPTDPIGYSVNSVTFHSDDRTGYVLAGQPGAVLSIKSSINESSLVTENITEPVALLASQTWTTVLGLNVTGGINLASSSLIVGGAGSTLLANVTGTGGLSLNGSSATNLTFAGTSTYTGPTNISAGVVSIPAGVVVGTGVGNVATVAPVGTLLINGGTLNALSLVVAAGTAQQSSGVVNVNHELNLQGLQLSGFVAKYNLTGGNVTVADDTLLSPATTTGLTQNSVGAIFNQSGGTHTTPALYFAGKLASIYILSGGTLATDQIIYGEDPTGQVFTGPGTFNFSGGTLQATSTDSAFMTGLTAANVTAGGAVIDPNGHLVTIAQPLLHAGSVADGGLTVKGSGTLVLTGANTYNGPTTIIDSANLQIGNAAALPSGADVAVASGGTLTLASTIASGAVTVGGLTGSGTVVLPASASSPSPVTLTVGAGNASTTFAGAFTGSGGFTKIGTGTLTLSGSGSYTGPTLVTAGTLAVVSDVALGSSTVTVGPAATLLYTGSTTISRTILLQNSSLASAAGTTPTLAGAFVTGGYLSGQFNATTGTALSADTAAASASITASSGVTLTNFTSRGRLSTLGAVAWTGVNAGSGQANVTAGVLTATDLESDGVLTIFGGATLASTDTLTLAGGGRTYVNAGAAVTVQAGSTVELNGALLVNNGAVGGGSVDVNFGSLATGAGTASAYTTSAGGTYAPGVYGVGTPAANPALTAAAIQPAAAGTTVTASPVAVTADVLITVNGTDALTLAGGLNPTGHAVTKLGTGTLTVPPFAAASLNVSAGTLQLAAASAVFSVGALSIAAGGTLDLGSAAADVTSADLKTVAGLITAGRLVSSTAAADTAHLTAVGVIQNNQGGSAIYTAARPFRGWVPGAGDVLVAFTYFGDANLDGKVDGSDYSRIDNGYITHATGWYNGDFNYDGAVDGSDYTLIDNVYNRQTYQLQPTALVASPVAVPAAVPEPAVSLILATSLLGLTRRRSRSV